MGAFASLNPFATLPTSTSNDRFIDSELLGITLAPDIYVEEHHENRMTITDHPIAEGATISDHAYNLPDEVNLTYGWAAGGPANSALSPTFLNELYAKLVQIKESASLVRLSTGRKVYTNMLIENVSQTTDKDTENALVVRIRCRKVFLMQLTTTQVPFDQTRLLNPANSTPTSQGGVLQLDPAPNFNQQSYAQIP